MRFSWLLAASVAPACSVPDRAVGLGDDEGESGDGESGASDESATASGTGASSSEGTDTSEASTESGSESTGDGGGECGNGLLEEGEECDDGNVSDGDACSIDCVVEAGAATIASGAFFNCALRGMGQVRCWGHNYDGQLGLGHVNTIGDDETPAESDDVQLGEPAIGIGAGGGHGCAILEDASLKCWGANDHGQLGQGNTNNIGDDELPSTIDAVDLGGLEVKQVVAGLAHTCVRVGEGDVACWGMNNYGQLGYGSTDDIGDDEDPGSAGLVELGAKAVDLEGDFHQVCAILEDQSLICWGRNDFGQLGLGHTDPIGDDETPAQASVVDVGVPVRAVAIGVQFTCAVTVNDTVRCWGAGDSGRLGYANTDDIGDDESPSSAGDVDVGFEVAGISAGFDHACAWSYTGEVRCWGGGFFGKTGHANQLDVGDDETPGSIAAVMVGRAVDEVELTWETACGRTHGAEVRCWGNGATGQIGYGNMEVIGDDEHPQEAGDVPLY